ncbi:MAG TPA: hypothetical protein VFU02_09470 [Polyangiaceae bacterium]|nr:hypothetical protein [Polyangiaceae bacterium]
MTLVDVKTQWRGQADTKRWRFYALVALSMLLHSALTPWAALLGLLGLLGLSDRPPTVDLPPITAIPIDLIEAPAPVPVQSDPEPEEEPSGAVVLPPSPEPLASPAGKEPTPEPAREPTPDKPPGTGAGEEAKDPEKADQVGDPVALSGAAGKLAKSGAKVRIKIDTDKVRQHALGPRIGEILGRVPQWHDFLGPAKLDPIRDIDRLLIAGPQLRDSSEVVAVLRYNVPEPVMETAIDHLVQRSSGEWLSGATRAATARADRAERIFAFFAPGLLAIVPPTAKRDALKAWPKNTRLDPIPGDAVLLATVETPHLVHTGLPFSFPETLEWVRASVTPSAGGGAVAVIEAQDASEDLAREHAQWLERRVLATTKLKGFAATAAKLVYGTDSFVDKVSFRAEGTRIRGTLSITADQIETLLKMVEGIINQWNPKPAATPGASASGPVPAPLVPPSAGPAGLPSAPAAEDAPLPGPAPEPVPPAPEAAPEQGTVDAPN